MTPYIPSNKQLLAISRLKDGTYEVRQEYKLFGFINTHKTICYLHVENISTGVKCFTQSDPCCHDRISQIPSICFIVTKPKPELHILGVNLTGRFMQLCVPSNRLEFALRLHDLLAPANSYKRIGD